MRFVMFAFGVASFICFILRLTLMARIFLLCVPAFSGDHAHGFCRYRFNLIFRLTCWRARMNSRVVIFVEFQCEVDIYACLRHVNVERHFDRRGRLRVSLIAASIWYIYLPISYVKS